MAELQLEIEGEGAVAAAEALLQIPDDSAHWVSETQTQKEATIAVIATIVGMTAGTLAIAESLHKWYQHHRQPQSGKRIDKVLLIGRNGQKIVLKNATVEQIKKILDS